MVDKFELNGNWDVLKGKIKKTWSAITNDELLEIEGDFDQLYGMLEERYGLTREEAEEKFNKLINDSYN